MVGMSVSHLEPLLRDAERRAVARVLRSHPEWTLGDVLAYVDKGGARSAALRSLPLGELLEGASLDQTAEDRPEIDERMLRRARMSTGAEFDELVRRVIAAAGSGVGAAYLRARVGGPRWKLQSSLRRLTEDGVIERSGNTCGTRYCAVGRSEMQP